MRNKLKGIANEILMVEKDFEKRVEVLNESSEHKEEYGKITIDDFFLYSFEQYWSNTALGFDAFGCDILTFATTYVLIPKARAGKKCFVYFAGRFAYSVDYTEEFGEDVRNYNMKPVVKSWEYNRKDLFDEKKE